MRVLYRQYIPHNLDSNGNVIEDNKTGVFSDFIHKGSLVHWGVGSLVGTSGTSIYTVAIVKTDEGFFVRIHPDNLKEMPL